MCNHCNSNNENKKGLDRVPSIEKEYIISEKINYALEDSPSTYKYCDGPHDWGDWGSWYNAGSNHRREKHCKKCDGYTAETASHKHHEWEKPTCTSGVSCYVCSASMESALGHDFYSSEQYCRRSGCGAINPGYNPPPPSHTCVWGGWTDWKNDGGMCTRLRFCTRYSNCNKYQAEKEEHFYTDGSVETDCGTCFRCDYTRSHSWWIKDAVWLDVDRHQKFYRCSGCDRRAESIGNGPQIERHGYFAESYDKTDPEFCIENQICSAHLMGCTASRVVRGGKHQYEMQEGKKVCKVCGRGSFPEGDHEFGQGGASSGGSRKVQYEPFNFTTEEYANLVGYINDKLTAYNKTKIPTTSVSKGSNVTAALMNNIVYGLQRLGASGIPTIVDPGSRVTADFLNRLSDAASSVKPPKEEK